MFERYIIAPDSLRNVEENGAVTGFAFDVRIAYYRGLALSMVEGFEVSVDGQSFDPTSMALRVGSETFTFAEMETEVEARWEFNQTATLIIHHAGGLKPGKHTINVTEILRVSYMPEPARRIDSKTLEVA